MNIICIKDNAHQVHTPCSIHYMSHIYNSPGGPLIISILTSKDVVPTYVKYACNFKS